MLSVQPDYEWAEQQGLEVPDEVRFLTEGDFVLDENGSADDVVLTFASPFADLPERIAAFATEVTDRSRRSIALDGDSDDGAEAGIIADVESGAVDIAWVGTRAFPEFDPLMAPLLVDSYDLKSAVYEAGIPARLGESLAQARPATDRRPARAAGQDARGGSGARAARGLRRCSRRSDAQ